MAGAPKIAFFALVCLSAPSQSDAQSISRESFVRQSEILAFEIGRTFEMGRQCNVTLDGLSRSAASLLFGPYVPQAEAGQILTHYDLGVNSSSRAACDQRWLTDEIRNVNARMNYYLQTGKGLVLRR